MRLYIYIYIYTYIHTYIHTYVYVYIYIYREREIYYGQIRFYRLIKRGGLTGGSENSYDRSAMPLFVLLLLSC